MKIIIIKGGLGNQLFQLCKYIDLKRNYKNEKIKIDSYSGFLLDFKYNRNLEIKNLISNYGKVNIINIFINSLLIVINKKIPFFQKLLINTVINDCNNNKINKYYIKNLVNYQIFDGYFQYIDLVKNNIKEIIRLSRPQLNIKSNEKFEKLYKDIKLEKNSIALCFRSYQDAKDPLEHSYQRRKIKVDDYNRVITKMENELDKPHFFIFSQNNNEFIKSLKFKSEKTYVLGNKGYSSSWPTLKAQMLCRHQILNNSTFYFWGLIFSEYFYEGKDKNKIVFITNNFINQKVYDSSWRKF